MEELIKITKDNEGNNLVSARELYNFLEISRDFTTWIKKMFEYGFQENKDFTPVQGKSTGGRPSVDYALTLDCSKEIAMIQRTDKGKQARQYFIAVEKQYKQAISKPLSTLDMLELSIKQLREQNERVSAIEDKVNRIEANTHNRPEYMSVVGFASLNNINVGLKLAASIGRKASKICKENDYTIETIPDPRFGRVNIYPQSVLEEVFNQPIN